MSRSAEIGSARKDPSNQTPGVPGGVLPDGAALRTIQRRRKRILRIGVVVLLVLVAGSQAMAERQSELHDMIEATGLFAIGICIFGRGWCSLYIGGRKAQTLTDVGPYSISRNPLYLFSFIGAAGIGAQTGSMLIATLFAAGAVAIFLPVILREERALEELFGVPFIRYKERVPRFGPAFSCWKDADTIEVRPKLVWRTLRDGLVFLMFIPLFEAIDWLQAEGFIHPLIHLP